LCKGRCTSVTIRGNRYRWINGPANTDSWIGETDSSFSLRVVNTRRLVLHLTPVCEGTKSASKSVRGPDLLFIISRYFHAKPLPQGWGALTNVNGNQECGASGHAHKLTHGRVPLKMKAAKHAFGRTRMIILYEFRRQPKLPKLIRAERFHKEAPRVSVDLGGNNHDIVQVHRFNSEWHDVRSLSFANNSRIYIANQYVS